MNLSVLPTNHNISLEIMPDLLYHKKTGMIFVLYLRLRKVSDVQWKKKMKSLSPQN